MKKLISLLMVAVMVCCAGAVLADDFGILPNPDRDELEMIKDINVIRLIEGWNLIAMPVIPNKPISVEMFMGMVADVGGSVDAVAVYKNGRFEVYPRKHASYNMVPGEAYFVSYSGPGRRILDDEPDSLRRHAVTIKIEGHQHGPVSLNLNRGWNGISIIQEKKAGFDENGVSITRLSRELSGQGLKARMIALWNAVMQEWELYMSDGVYPDLILDRLIMPGEGFFLFCKENGLYIPELDIDYGYDLVPRLPPQ